MAIVKKDIILYIDCKTGNTETEEITEEWRKNYIGGTGINTKILFDSGAMYEDALSEKNVLIFGIGPAVGSKLPAGNRCTITAKSPLTDMYGDSNVGGHFVINMRSLRINHIVLKGKAEKLSYIYIKKNGTVVLEDASEIRGMEVSETTDFLRNKHGTGCEVACIGPSGENKVRFANILVSKYHAAGKMGMGCVMGSKNIKAIVIERKPLRVVPYDKEKLKQVINTWVEANKHCFISKSTNIDGTLMLIGRYGKAKQIPVMNSQQGDHEKLKDLSVDEFVVKYETNRMACYSCIGGCNRAYEIPDGKYKGEKGKRIDYGAAVSVGPEVGIFKWDELIHLKVLTDEIGVDSIELGGVISLFLEGCKRKLIDEKYLEGRNFEFGNPEDVEYLMRAIANNEGIGTILGQGTYRAAEILGLQKYAMCIRKAQTGAHSKDRLAWSLGYVTSTRGGDHLKGFPFTMVMGGYWGKLIQKHIFHYEKNIAPNNPEGQGKVLWWHENYKTAVDSLGVCFFQMQAIPNIGHGYFDELVVAMNALCGTDMTEEDMFYAAERVYQLQNMFNIHCGLTLNDYKWPVRNPDEDIKEEYIDNTTIKVMNEPGMLPEYFKFRGLSSEGKPTINRIKELNLLEEGKTSVGKLEEDGFTLEDALKEVSLSINYTRMEAKIVFFLSNLLVKALTNKAKKRYKMKAQTREKINKNKD